MSAYRLQRQTGIPYIRGTLQGPQRSGQPDGLPLGQYAFDSNAIFFNPSSNQT